MLLALGFLVGAVVLLALAMPAFEETKEDWRNREKWDQYKDAVCDMIDRTSTQSAPWTLVEANNKLYARLKILRTLCNALESRLLKSNG